MEIHVLLDFIQIRMRLAHIYQPAMIRTWPLPFHVGELFRHLAVPDVD